MIKRIGLALALLLLGCYAASAQTLICYQAASGLNCQKVSVNTGLPGRSATYGVGLGVAPQYCQITSTGSAFKLITANCASGTILANATIAQICVETAAMRYTSSGVVVPTSSVGMPIAAGTCFQYAGPLSTVQFIQQASGAILDVETFP